jgi:hypothetical protein
LGVEVSRKRFDILKILILSSLIIFSSVLAVVSFLPADAHFDWQNIVEGSVSATPQGKNLTELGLTTTSVIPAQSNTAFVGFGWLYEDGTSAYVAGTHRGHIDSVHRPNGWHPHNVVIEEVTGVPAITHCITEITDTEHAGLAINQDSIKLNVKNNDLLSPLMNPPTAISFDIIPWGDCELGTGIAIHQMEPAPVQAAEEKKGGGNPNK